MVEEIVVRIQGNDLSVVVEWSDEDGTYTKKLPPAVVEPPEVVIRSPFPATPGAWKFMNRPDGFRAWVDEIGVQWVQYNSLAYTNNPNVHADRGLPSLTSLGPSNDPDELVIARLNNAYAEREYGTIGIRLWDEEGWDAKAQQWYDWIRENCPEWIIVSGPIPWTVWPEDDHKLGFVDAILSYQNCTRKGRLPEDVGYHRMMANYWNKPFYWSVNPVDSTPKDAPWTLSDAAKYQRGLDLAEIYADTFIVWKLEGLWEVASGRVTVTNPEQAAGIIAGIKAWRPKAAPAERIFIYLPDEFDWRAAKACARIAVRAGFDPVATRIEAQGQVDLDDLLDRCGILRKVTHTRPTVAEMGWADICSRFNEMDRWTQEIEDIMVGWEEQMAAALREEM